MNDNPPALNGPPTLIKTPFGIAGIDEITGGGLPHGRSTLVAGDAGCGKTLLAMEFLVHGAIDHGEPGVFISFEEAADDLARNVASLGFDLPDLERRGLLRVASFEIAPDEFSEIGEYDLGGLFVRIERLIDAIGAQRIVIDTLETLLVGFANERIIRQEFRRLLRWLNRKGVTTITTAERGDGRMTRFGLEEYVADCVIELNHRVVDQISTRHLRFVKYRGTLHGTNEYPFIIGERGIVVLPITSIALDYTVSEERVSSGVPALDTMLGGEGFYRDSTILITGSAGTGKTSLVSTAVDAACRRGERCLYMAFEEAPAQIIRNMRSIGLDLQQWVEQDRLQFAGARPSAYGLERHLIELLYMVDTFDPRFVVLDPVTSFEVAGLELDVTAMLARLIDGLKSRGVTVLCTSLTTFDRGPNQSEVGISSLMDVWIGLRNLESNGERNRGLYILKARGTAHSNQIRELIVSSSGLDLAEVFTGQGQVLAGAARLAEENRLRSEAKLRDQERARRRREFERRRAVIAAQIESLEAELAFEEEDLERINAQAALERRLENMAANSCAGAGSSVQGRRHSTI
jgi:circadian clock protein KaiC